MNTGMLVAAPPRHEGQRNICTRRP
jgi:hypothetical protein